MYQQIQYSVQMEVFPFEGQGPSLYYLKVKNLQQNTVTSLVWYRGWSELETQVLQN